MSWLRQSVEKKSHLLVGLVLAGFLAGLFFMCTGKEVFLENTDILSEYTLYEMKYAAVDGNAFFWYVLQKRVGSALILAILSTTWLGLAATWAYAGWLGVSFGMLVMAAILRYGIKGILLILVGIFPQGIIYFPVCLLLLQWSHDFCMSMYYPHKMAKEVHAGGETSLKGILMKKKGIQFLVLIGVVLIGCMLESYVNPKLVFNLLKIF